MFHESALYIGQHDRFGDGRMVMMLKRFFSDPKRMILVVAAAVVLAFVCLALLMGLGWRVYRNQATPEPTVVPVDIGYCGDRLTSLCVVSFGRDVFGKTVINFYVPQRRYPLFYLNIVRASGVGKYECETNKKISTSVLCTGEAINLGEGFEIQVLSVKNDSLLARGSFTLTAYLITTPVISDAADSDSDLEETPTPPTSFEEQISTSTPTISSSSGSTATDTSTPTPTSTSSSAYPYP